LVDLLEIASYVYSADFSTKRGGTWYDDGTTESWDRDFLFVIPVREPDFWGSEEVNQALVDVLEFISGERFRFVFVKLRKERKKQQYLTYGGETAQFVGVDRVHMFSGGLDSLAGAVQEAAAGGRLVLVSHRPVAQIARRQLDLCEAMRTKFSAPRVLHIPIWIHYRPTVSRKGPFCPYFTLSVA
jgi:hypothetical protein